MKKNCLLILMTLSFHSVFSQVGINTQNPQGILHIDGQKIIRCQDQPLRRLSRVMMCS